MGEKCAKKRIIKLIRKTKKNNKNAFLKLIMPFIIVFEVLVSNEHKFCRGISAVT